MAEYKSQGQIALFQSLSDLSAYGPDGLLSGFIAATQNPIALWMYENPPTKTVDGMTVLTGQFGGIWFLITGGAFGTPTTIAFVSTTNGTTTTPYSVQPTDSVIEFQSSGGQACQANLPSAPIIGEQHTFVWMVWETPSDPPPFIGGNGYSVTPFTQGTQTSGAAVSRTALTSRGAMYTVRWDGNQWMQVSQ